MILETGFRGHKWPYEKRSCCLWQVWGRTEDGERKDFVSLCIRRLVPAQRSQHVCCLPRLHSRTLQFTVIAFICMVFSTNRVLYHPPYICLSTYIKHLRFSNPRNVFLKKKIGYSYTVHTSLFSIPRSLYTLHILNKLILNCIKYNLNPTSIS